MKLKKIALLLVVVLVLGMYVHAQTAGNYMATDPDGIITYANTFAEITADLAEGAVVTLRKSVTEDITVSKNLQLELNGNTITGNVEVTEGVTLQVSDSATADYDVTDGQYGKIKVTGAGTVKGATATENSDVYLQAEEEDGYISFHAAKLNIDEMVLRPEQQGLYFNHQFDGDEKVQTQLLLIPAVR